MTPTRTDKAQAVYEALTRCPECDFIKQKCATCQIKDLNKALQGLCVVMNSDVDLREIAAEIERLTS